MTRRDPDEPAWWAWRRRAFGAFLASALVIGLFLSFRPTGFETEEVAQEEPTTPPSRANRPNTRPKPAPSKPAEEATDGLDGLTDEEADALIEAARPPEETTVQVLDAGGGSSATSAAQDALTEMGYDVVATNTSRIDYPETTVLYTEGNDAEAEALRARDARFGEIALNERLSDAVDIHVVVGPDWE